LPIAQRRFSGFWGSNYEKKNAGHEPGEIKFDPSLDYYDMLEVSKYSSEVEIRAAYREKMNEEKYLQDNFGWAKL